MDSNIKNELRDLIFTYYPDDNINDAVLLHTCPYATDIHDDYTTLCACGEAKMQQCCEDI